MVLIFASDGAAFSHHSEEPCRFSYLAPARMQTVHCFLQCVRWSPVSRLAETSNFIRDARRKRHADRPSRNGGLDRQPLHLVNSQFRQVVRDDGHVASETNERCARQGFGCKTDFAAPTALTEPETARRYLPIPPISWAIKLDVVVWLPRAQIQRLFGFQAWRLSRVSLTTIPMKRFVKPGLLTGEPCFLVAAVSSRKPPSMQTRGTARIA